ncbi:hypothetical protein DFH09DRAFT_627133 [Mycena vulgaris]|nr:hypothetical protein DFH09DRAFT_627133 [Mycena vulgaris]
MHQLCTAPPCASAARSPSPRAHRRRRRPSSPYFPCFLLLPPRSRCLHRAPCRGRPSPPTRRVATTPSSRLPFRRSSCLGLSPRVSRDCRVPPPLSIFVPLCSLASPSPPSRLAALLSPPPFRVHVPADASGDEWEEYDDVPLSPLVVPAPAPPLLRRSRTGSAPRLTTSTPMLMRTRISSRRTSPLRRGPPITRANTGSAPSARAGPPPHSPPCTPHTRAHMRRARRGLLRSRGGTSPPLRPRRPLRTLRAPTSGEHWEGRRGRAST